MPSGIACAERVSKAGPSGRPPSHVVAAVEPNPRLAAPDMALNAVSRCAIRVPGLHARQSEFTREARSTTMTASMPQASIAARAARLLGDEDLSATRLHGGDLSLVLRVQLASGRSVVAKSAPGVAREARMLRALSAAGGRVPHPIAWDADVLVMEDLGATVPPSDEGWRSLAASLRAVHRPTPEHYGWTEDHAFGAVRIPNARSDCWATFWIEQRLMAECSALPVHVARRLATLEDRVRVLLPTRPGAALLHGDLWAGNVHFSAAGQASLIDPASFYGHAEVDLAMLSLFGSPPASFWDGYGMLDPGWPERRIVYQLWPALVHVRLFGSAYDALVDRLIAKLEG